MSDRFVLGIDFGFPSPSAARLITCPICGDKHEVLVVGGVDHVGCPSVAGDIKWAIDTSVWKLPNPENAVARPLLERMEVVHNCGDCCFRSNGYDEAMCNLTSDTIKSGSPPSDCPLRGVTVFAVLHERKET